MGKLVKATAKGYYGGKVRLKDETFELKDEEDFSEEWMEDPNAPPEEADEGSEDPLGAFPNIKFVPVFDEETGGAVEPTYTPPEGLNSDNLTVEHVLDFAAAYRDQAEEDELSAKGFIKKVAIERHMGVDVTPKVYALYMNQADAIGTQQAK